MSPIFKKRNISMFIKLQTSKPHVLSVRLYGCECWNMSTNIEKKLETPDMWYLRRLMKIPWTYRRTNEEVLQLDGVQRSLMKTIRKRLMKLLGHISKRMESRNLYFVGKLKGKRSRQRKLYMGCLNTFATQQQMTNTELIHLTHNRED